MIQFSLWVLVQVILTQPLSLLLIIITVSFFCFLGFVFFAYKDSNWPPLVGGALCPKPSELWHESYHCFFNNDGKCVGRGGAYMHLDWFTWSVCEVLLIGLLVWQLMWHQDTPPIAQVWIAHCFHCKVLGSSNHPMPGGWHHHHQQQ